MKSRSASNPKRINHQRLRSFTLVELLVSMGIIAILAAITVVGVSAVAEGTKLASGRNTIEAALETARGYAIKNNTIVMVAFRAKLVNESTEVVEVITAKYSGVTNLGFGWTFTGGARPVDRYVPIEEIPARDLPGGIKVAGPHYKTNVDSLWLATSNLRTTRLASGEMGGGIIAVMYGPDGNTLRDNPATDSIESWIDFNASSDRTNFGGIRQQQGGQAYLPTDPDLNDGNNYCDCGDVIEFDGTRELREFYCQRQPDDEPYVTTVPFLAVFNDEEARELYDPSTWSDGSTRIADQSDYINSYADRIHFNRYSGVVMK